jgi:hypothetical protein
MALTEEEFQSIAQDDAYDGKEENFPASNSVRYDNGSVL